MKIVITNIACPQCIFLYHFKFQINHNLSQWFIFIGNKKRGLWPICSTGGILILFNNSLLSRREIGIFGKIHIKIQIGGYGPSEAVNQKSWTPSFVLCLITFLYQLKNKHSKKLDSIRYRITCILTCNNSVYEGHTNWLLFTHWQWTLPVQIW